MAENILDSREDQMETVRKWVPVVAGGSLIAYGIGARSRMGAALALVGGGMIWAGVRRDGSATSAVEEDSGFYVTKAITIDSSPEELYRFWRKFSNLSRIMKHLESVHSIDDRRSHWVAKGPAGRNVEWDAEIIADDPPSRIAWQSLEGSDIDCSGSVEFVRADRGTEVRVSMQYEPPAGLMGKTVAKLFGEDPSWTVAEDLRRLKQLLETGEISSTEGQPAGR
jgi:Predicted integral membrane protein